MNVPNLTLPISRITINIVEMNWQEQRNFMFIQSSAFINNVQQPNFMPTYLTAILALVAFVVPALLDLIDLKFQKEANSVFEAHPATTMMAFASLLAFVLAFGIDFTFHSSHFSPICAALLRTAMMFSGSLLLASLASLLLPDALRPFLYVFYAFLSLANLHDLLRKCSLWIHLKIMDNLDTVLTAMRQWHMRRRDSKQLGIRVSDDYWCKGFFIREEEEWQSPPFVGLICLIKELLTKGTQLGRIYAFLGEEGELEDEQILLGRRLSRCDHCELRIFSFSHHSA